MTTYEFMNDTHQFFEGFYETLIGEDVVNDDLQDTEHPETYEVDWKAYMHAIGERYTELLNKYCVNNIDNKIIHKIDFIKVSSPKYYNYTTDKLILNIDFNMFKLDRFCLHDNKRDFEQYLKEHYTSHSGYVSFINNTITSFQHQLKEDNRCIGVMLEYYMIRCKHDMDSYSLISTSSRTSELDCELYEELFEIQIEHAKEVSEV